MARQPPSVDETCPSDGNMLRSYLMRQGVLFPLPNSPKRTWQGNSRPEQRTAGMLDGTSEDIPPNALDGLLLQPPET